MPVVKSLAAPLRAYFNPRFESIAGSLSLLDGRADQVDRQLEALATDVDKLLSGALAPTDAARIAQSELLARIDLREHNADPRPPRFDALECQSASASQCDEPAFREWSNLIEELGRGAGRAAVQPQTVGVGLHRRSGTGGRPHGTGQTRTRLWRRKRAHAGRFRPTRVQVLATDQGWEAGQEWASNNELMGADLTGLSRPHVVADGRTSNSLSVTL